MKSIESSDIKVSYVVSAHNKEDIDSGMMYALFLYRSHVIERTIKYPLKSGSDITIVARELNGDNIRGLFDETNRRLLESKDRDQISEGERNKKCVNVVNYPQKQNPVYCIADTATNTNSDFVVVYDGTTYFNKGIFTEVDNALEKLVQEPETTGFVLSAPREFDGAYHNLQLKDCEGNLTQMINGSEKEKIVDSITEEALESKKVPTILVYRKSEFEKLKDLYDDNSEIEFFEKNSKGSDRLSMIEQIIEATMKNPNFNGKIKHISTNYNFMDIRKPGKIERGKLATFDEKWGDR